MKIYNFEVADRCLFWNGKKILIAGDLHLGYEESLNFLGSSVLRNQLNETIVIFKSIFKKIGKVKKIILLGDVKHYFKGILKQEYEDFEKIIFLFRKNMTKNGKIIITKGNHDNVLEPIAKKYNDVFLFENYSIEDVLFLHGNKRSIEKSRERITDKKIKKIVLGHFNPAYTVEDVRGIKKEKYKCFLYGKSKKYGKKTVFVPSFFPIAEGKDIMEKEKIYEKKMNIVCIDEFGNSYCFKDTKLKKPKN